MKRLAWLLLVCACKDDGVTVKPEPADDYNHGKLVAAVDAFIAAKRTPDAYRALAHTVAQLRPGMDATVAGEAERRLIVLALDPEQALAQQPMAAQQAALALSVWPTLLAPPIAADQLDAIVDPKAGDLPPKAGETAGAYLERICSGPLAARCKHVVPEWQGTVVGALAIRDATERVRTAVSECLECDGSGADPGWQRAIAGWEALDRDAATASIRAEATADPHNWPIAGAASDEDPQLPEAELSLEGDLVAGGEHAGTAAQRIAALRALRGTATAIALHVHPEQTLAQVRAVLDDARTAGCQRVAVIAREPVYPYRRRAYWIAEGTGVRANLRPTDSLQLLLHAIDDVAGPGTVARID